MKPARPLVPHRDTPETERDGRPRGASPSGAMSRIDRSQPAKRRLYIIEDKPGGEVIVSYGIDHLREEQIHRLESRLRARYRVDEPDSGLVLRDSLNDPPLAL